MWGVWKFVKFAAVMLMDGTYTIDTLYCVASTWLWALTLQWNLKYAAIGLLKLSKSHLLSSIVYDGFILKPVWNGN